MYPSHLALSVSKGRRVGNGGEFARPFDNGASPKSEAPELRVRGASWAQASEYMEEGREQPGEQSRPERDALFPEG